MSHFWQDHHCVYRGPQLTNGLLSKFPFVSRLFGSRNPCDTDVRSVNNCSQVRVSARRPPVRKCGRS
jgi:hypothetical protein